MGWRLRKSIKVAPGVRLNLSKSGVSTTVGKKGLSFNIGKRGVYRNVSIPGTGLYRRDKIGSGSAKKSRSKSTGRTPQNSSRTKGVETISRKPDSKPLSTSREEREGQLHPSSAMEGLWLSVAGLSTVDSLKREIDALQPERYVPSDFLKSAPSLETLEECLSREADDAVKERAFWKVYRLKDEYVKAHAEERYEELYSAWEQERNEFFEAESERERSANEQFIKECEEQKQRLRSRIDGDLEYVYPEIQAMLRGLDVPFSQNLKCTSTCESGMVSIDIALPPAFVFPTTERLVRKDGTVKEKEKTQKSMREEYAQYVFNLVAYIAARTFDVSPSMEEVACSAHALRENKFGNYSDDYLLSVVFARETVCEAVRSNDSAEELCLASENRCNVTKTKIFKAIEPFSISE
ncbi:DUF4236 domain-containing protein [Collinsella provencensis]|uniref:DUF4236 domain-containing protein n=1 Tax=Collinsella provencensis TaxID=1937461 RepID=UPI000C867728|nr:DUF4236 domain-containing protein [Collinsella provencensis]